MIIFHLYEFSVLNQSCFITVLVVLHKAREKGSDIQALETDQGKET